MGIFDFLKGNKDVKFVEELKKTNGPVEYIYKIYNAPNKESAMKFLENQKVNRNYLYLQVETPEGKFCKDIDGFYEV